MEVVKDKLCDVLWFCPKDLIGLVVTYWKVDRVIPVEFLAHGCCNRWLYKLMLLQQINSATKRSEREQNDVTLVVASPMQHESVLIRIDDLSYGCTSISGMLERWAQREEQSKLPPTFEWRCSPDDQIALFKESNQHALFSYGALPNSNYPGKGDRWIWLMSPPEMALLWSVLGLHLGDDILMLVFAYWTDSMSVQQRRDRIWSSLDKLQRIFDNMDTKSDNPGSTRSPKVLSAGARAEKRRAQRRAKRKQKRTLPKKNT